MCRGWGADLKFSYNHVNLMLAQLFIQDFPSMQWFLPFCFGGDAPEGSMVRRCRDVTDDNINELVKEFPIPFAHLKSRASKLTNDSKARIAGYEKRLDTVLWYVWLKLL